MFPLVPLALPSATIVVPQAPPFIQAPSLQVKGAFLAQTTPTVLTHRAPLPYSLGYQIPQPSRPQSSGCSALPSPALPTLSSSVQAHPPPPCRAGVPGCSPLKDELHPRRLAEDATGGSRQLSLDIGVRSEK